jgi:hypothetical protein
MEPSGEAPVSDITHERPLRRQDDAVAAGFGAHALTPGAVPVQV